MQAFFLVEGCRWVASGGTILGSTIPAYHLLGGLLNLGGFAAGPIRGQRFALARLRTYTLIRMLPAEVGGGLYVAVIGEAADAWTAERDLHRSITLMTAADTTIGPVRLAVARADGSNQRFYVAIGKPSQWTFSQEMIVSGVDRLVSGVRSV